MCGIYATNLSFDKNTVLKKLKSIEYRGPDNVGYSEHDEVIFGHLRLSILDLDERSNQPFSYEHLTMVYNGEIYNFEDIKQELIKCGYEFATTGDTEVIIKGYREWGEKVLFKLNGMFSFVIYNSQTKQIFCARDRMGVKPFFYYWKDKKFEICSQLGPLINSDSEVSEKAISFYLDLGYIPSPFSILEDVYKLAPGKYVTIDLKSGEKQIETYWDLKKVKIRDINYENAKEELHNLLIDAVKIRLQSDVPLGSFLSGGIDSALISSIASRLSSNQINTFTIGFEDPKYDESKVAHQFANIIQSNHREIICSPEEIKELIPKLIEVYDEPFADSSALPSLLLNKVTKKYVTVALSGDGGDESFFGYNHFDLMVKFLKLSIIPYSFRRVAAKLPWHKLINSQPTTISRIIATKDTNEFALNTFKGQQKSLQKRVNVSWLQHYLGYEKNSDSALQRMADLNIKLWLENDSNVKVDRASMAYSVEVRSPFLDYRIIEYARSLPINYRFSRGIKKRITKDILKEYIPEKLFNQPKKGFSVPIGKWIREDLRKDIYESLNDEFLYKVPNLNIKLLKQQLKDHMEMKYDYSTNIWKLFLLAKWDERFQIIKHNSK